MKEARAFLLRQRKSREALANSVRKYLALRRGMHEYTDTIYCTNADGEAVVVLLRLDIVPSPEGEK